MVKRSGAGDCYLNGVGSEQHSIQIDIERLRSSVPAPVTVYGRDDIARTFDARRPKGARGDSLVD